VAFSAIVDARYAAAMTRARRWIADDWLPLLGKLGASPNYDDVLVLDSIGFLRVGSAKIFRPVGDVPVLTPFVHTGIATYANSRSPEAAYTMPGALLTIAGKEMLQIMPAEEDREVIHHIAMRMKEMGFGRVQIGTLKRENGRVRLENATDVES
jgi:hypothetical protein